jgi:hypothetical protein
MTVKDSTISITSFGRIATAFTTASDESRFAQLRHLCASAKGGQDSNSRAHADGARQAYPLQQPHATSAHFNVGLPINTPARCAAMTNACLAFAGGIQPSRASRHIRVARRYSTPSCCGHWFFKHSNASHAEETRRSPMAPRLMSTGDEKDLSFMTRCLPFCTKQRYSRSLNSKS